MEAEEGRGPLGLTTSLWGAWTGDTGPKNADAGKEKLTLTLEEDAGQGEVDSNLGGGCWAKRTRKKSETLAPKH